MDGFPKDEIFNADTQVNEIATFWYGKCFQLDIPTNFTYKDWVYMGVITEKQLFVHFVDQEQWTNSFGFDFGVSAISGHFRPKYRVVHLIEVENDRNPNV